MTIDKKFKTKLAKEVGPLSFALFMRVTRHALGLTQEEFGKKLGISRANVCDIEKGRHLVSAEFAVRVARKVGYPEKMALQACLQDQVRKAGSEALVKVS
jgi:DNA-binding XRE family transcriptional regulator